MTAREWLAVGALVLSSTATSACHHHAASADTGAAAAQMDSLIGIVSVTGTSFEQHIVLRTDSAIRPLTASSSDSASLTRLGGVEVAVRGLAEGASFRVATFEARRVDGAPVIDGVVIRDAHGVALQTQGRRVALGNPPAALDSLVGARIWVSGSPESGPNSYGVIAPP